MSMKRDKFNVWLLSANRWIKEEFVWVGENSEWNLTRIFKFFCRKIYHLFESFYHGFFRIRTFLKKYYV